MQSALVAELDTHSCLVSNGTQSWPLDGTSLPAVHAHVCASHCLVVEAASLVVRLKRCRSRICPASAPQEKARVDVAQWGGLVPANSRDARALAGMLRKGAVGLKAFMSPSGVPEFENVARYDAPAPAEFELVSRRAATRASVSRPSSMTMSICA